MKIGIITGKDDEISLNKDLPILRGKTQIGPI